MKEIIVNENVKFILSKQQTNPISITGSIILRGDNFPNRIILFALTKVNRRLFITGVGSNGFVFDELGLIEEVKAELINKILYEYAEFLSDELVKEQKHKEN